MLAVWAAFAACSASEAPRETIRLVDELANATLDWPADAVPLPKGSLVGAAGLAGVPRGDEPRALQVVRLWSRPAKDERLALVAPAGGSYRFALTLPERATLRVDLAQVPGSSTGGELTFRVRIAPAAGGEGVALLEHAVRAAEKATWQEVAVPLGRWGGERVVLELATLGGPEAGWGAWSSPRIDVDRVRDPRPSVVLISLDTLRADHLGSYGYGRPTSPNLDAFAQRGVRFEYPIAQAPWTRPSHRSMLGGLYPADPKGGSSRYLAVPLWHAGYRTVAVTGGGQVDSRFGFGAGFEVYRVEDWVAEPERLVEGIAASSPEPFFLFLHTFAIHEPYASKRFAGDLDPGRIDGTFSKAFQQRLGTSITDAEKRYAEALYDGGIADTDAQLGRFFAAAERAGWLDRAVVVVTSDHGEQFWEHGTWGHGQHLYDHQLRVPLIVSLPERLRRQWGSANTVGRVVSEQVRLVDLYPTLLELTGAPRPQVVAGRSMSPLLAGEKLPPVEAFAENVNIRSYERKGLRTDRYKLIRSFPRKSASGRDEILLFDLRADPGERFDLADLRPDLVEAMLERLFQHKRGETSDYEEELPEDIDPELRQRLQALGYLGG